MTGGRLFELFPAIDLLGGRVVRLRQGDYEQATSYSDVPAAVARSFADAGARWIHVVDLDAARDGGSANLGSIEAICAAAPECKVQTGGGVRTVVAAGERLSCGVARVVIGSAAVEDPELVGDLAMMHPGCVVVGLDVRGREVSTHGWTQGVGRDVFEVANMFADAGASAFIVTQIDVDGLLTGPDLELYRELLSATSIAVIASGGVGSIDDLVALRDLREHSRSLAGAIAGKAIYEGRFTVGEGMSACSPLG